jgi:hypothetical protein
MKIEMDEEGTEERKKKRRGRSKGGEEGSSYAIRKGQDL